MRACNQIVLASTNPDKFTEMSALISKYPGFELLPAGKLVRNAEKIGMVEIYSTYLENAVAKARLVNQGCHFPALADDSGLEVTALEGRPGPHSARYAKGSSQIEKLLKELDGQANRDARFVCTLAFVIEGTLITATGVLEGTISSAPTGKMGFGYDPIFIPRGENRTLAEMTETEKNAISHRAKAVELLMKEVQALGLQIAKP